MLLTDGKIFVGDVSRGLQLPAHLAFHTSRVEVRLVHLVLGIGSLGNYQTKDFLSNSSGLCRGTGSCLLEST